MVVGRVVGRDIDMEVSIGMVGAQLYTGLQAPMLTKA